MSMKKLTAAERVAKQQDASRYRSYELRVPQDWSGDELMKMLCAGGRAVKVDKDDYDGEEGVVLTLI